MKDQALDLVVSIVQAEADDLGYEDLRKAAADTMLFGGSDGVDSLSLVRLVTAVERAAEARFGKRVVLADEKAMSMRNSPFRTVGTLAQLLEERLGGGHA
jgi:acyl carrier protein